MLLEPSFEQVAGLGVRTKMDLIRRQGEAAVNRPGAIGVDEANAVVQELFHVLYWLAHTYSLSADQVPPEGLSFDAALLPEAIGQARETNPERLREWAREMDERNAVEDRDRGGDASLRKQLETLRDAIAAAKAKHRDEDDHNYDEEATRDRYIDLLLREAGWPLDDVRDREFEVSGMPNNSGIGYVDYVLWGDDGKPLGLVEAKRTRRDARVGRHQAKLYADCLTQRFGQRPVIFYSNGYETWLWDDERYPPRKVQGFYTKDELALAVQRRTGCRQLADVRIKPEIVERPYQHHAIRRIAERFEVEKQRRALVVMATGAGKTRTAIALVDLLMRAGWVKRTLFLADRVALVNQAVRAFKLHLPQAAAVNAVTERDAEGRVYVSTYPTMMGLIGGEGEKERRFGPGFFDLVVVDEAHRSVYQKYRSIFAYFDSLLVGLTATPKEDVDRNTYGLFDVKPGSPTDSYSLAEAVADGYLVPPHAVDVPLKFPREGLKYADLSEEEKEQWEEQDWGEDGEIPAEVDAEAVNRWLFNVDTVDKVLETLMSRGHRVAGGDRLGKTIIFAKNNEHAEFIAERFDANFAHYAGSFARVITYRTEYAQSLIDDFAMPSKGPHIAISVDMLDTGIDVPEIVNLVFFKRVRSKTKFLQMLGRGTRLRPGLYGGDTDKRDFLVFDCCDNVAFFNEEIEPAKVTLSPTLSQRLFSDRVELVLALAGESGGRMEGGAGEAGEVRAATVALLRKQVAAMDPDNFLIRPQREWVERYSKPDAWDALDEKSADQLAGRLAALPTSEEDLDEDAKRFDLMVLGLQLRLLRPQPGEERLQHQVREIAAGLLEQTAIPAIREREVLLEEIAGEDWWVDVTVGMLEIARTRVRGLVRLLEKRKRVIVYTDFTDELGEIEEVELANMIAPPRSKQFRERAALCLRRHLNDKAVSGLRHNLPTTSEDIDSIESLLLEEGIGDPSDLDWVQEGEAGVGTFVRSLVGLERGAAIEAFDVLTRVRPLTEDQRRFVDLVVDRHVANGFMDVEDLYEAPFTDIAPRGPEELFPEADVESLIEGIESIRRNAEPPQAS
ncbi:MAG TPA: DEAD/DEAH box helicase family protein [Solirubrobacterales bacterium]|nr:DEAD/DEAH box helicase family protein [Solirubrobacterales bacterium]